jgi:hypothetical protein
MAEFTIILERMEMVINENHAYLEAQDRSGDAIEAKDIHEAWQIALKKYHMDASKQNMQIVDIVPGVVEVKMPEYVPQAAPELTPEPEPEPESESATDEEVVSEDEQ